MALVGVSIISSGAVIIALFTRGSYSFSASENGVFAADQRQIKETRRECNDSIFRYGPLCALRRRLEGGALGHRRRCDPRPKFRPVQKISAGPAISHRGVLDAVGGREALRESSVRPNVRQRVRAGGTFYHRQAGGTGAGACAR